jgi:hypothetical protein
MIPTRQIFNSGLENGSINKAQLELFGLTFPLRKGWKETLIGKRYEADVIERFVALRSVPRVNPQRPEKKLRERDARISDYRKSDWLEERERLRRFDRIVETA